PTTEEAELQEVDRIRHLPQDLSIAVGIARCQTGGLAAAGEVVAQEQDRIGDAARHLAIAVTIAAEEVALLGSSDEVERVHEEAWRALVGQIDLDLGEGPTASRWAAGEQHAARVLHLHLEVHLLHAADLPPPDRNRRRP